MINSNYNSHTFDMAKSTAAQLCTGALLSKTFFPVIVKEGAVFCMFFGVATNLFEKVAFHGTSIEENLQNKMLVGLATVAVMYFVTTSLIAGPLLGRVTPGFSADKVFKLCISSFVTYVGYAIWQEKNQPREEESIERGAKVDEKDCIGRTSLHKAAWGGRERAIEVLIAKGAKVDEKDCMGETPLHKAARRGQEGAIEALIERGAKVDEEDCMGETPLQKAAWGGREGAIEALIAKGTKRR